jgi:choline dehydrogenase
MNAFGWRFALRAGKPFGLHLNRSPTLDLSPARTDRSIPCQRLISRFATSLSLAPDRPAACWPIGFPLTLYSWQGLVAKGAIWARWLLLRDGHGATNHFETCGFIRSRAGIRYPDIQYHFLPLAVTYDGKGLASEHGFQAHVGPMRSKSRGFVRLKSRDPREHPRIQFNYMSHEDDWTEMRACVRLTREIFAQEAFDPYRGREIQPGADVDTDETIDAFIRDKVESAYHPSCSCKMGSALDPTAVVDPTTRVIGLQSLRVVDSSIMPSITTGNLNAPTIMIGEKAADHILARPLAAASNASYYVAENWRTAQR